MTRQQRQSCRKKRSKLNLFRHGDVGAVLCRCRYQLRAARCHARRNWTPSGKYKRRHRLFDALRVVKAALHEQRWGVGSLPWP